MVQNYSIDLDNNYESHRTIHITEFQSGILVCMSERVCPNRFDRLNKVRNLSCSIYPPKESRFLADQTRPLIWEIFSTCYSCTIPSFLFGLAITSIEPSKTISGCAEITMECNNTEYRFHGLQFQYLLNTPRSNPPLTGLRFCFKILRGVQHGK